MTPKPLINGMFFFLCQIVFPASHFGAASIQIVKPTQVEVAVPRGDRIMLLPGDGAIFAPNDSVPLRALTNGLILNPAFAPELGRFPVARQQDGQIIARGSPTPRDAQGMSRCLLRLHLDGSVDLSFQAPLVNETFPTLFKFYTIVVQPDGKILAGYWWNPTAGSPIPPPGPGLFRMHRNGELENSFFGLLTDAFGERMVVRSIALYPDGRILAGGRFQTTSSPVSTCIVRFHPDGSRDPSFAATFLPRGGESGGIGAIAIQPDGKILVGGNYSKVNDVSTPGLVRLNSDGTRDTTFHYTGFEPGTPAGTFLALQPDGRLIISGSTVRRILPDGRPDNTFRVVGPPTDLALDESGRVYISQQNFIQRFSGQLRLQIPPAEIPTLLERTYNLSQDWTPLQTIPAHTPLEYVSTNFPDTDHHFYRTRPAP